MVLRGGSAGFVDGLVAALRSARALIVVDNCEHVIDGIAALVQGLVDQCPAVHVLATSREPLGVEAEHVWRAPSLAGC